MKRRPVPACLTTTAVVGRAYAEFDAVAAEGPADMTVIEMTRATAVHRAKAIPTRCRWMPPPLRALPAALAMIISTLWPRALGV
jgi:hypothetical protein